MQMFKRFSRKERFNDAHKCRICQSVIFSFAHCNRSASLQRQSHIIFVLLLLTRKFLGSFRYRKSANFLDVPVR
jgi:hypothetical protein